jgi:hypothetical protein
MGAAEALRCRPMVPTASSASASCYRYTGKREQAQEHLTTPRGWCSGGRVHGEVMKPVGGTRPAPPRAWAQGPVKCGMEVGSAAPAPAGHETSLPIEVIATPSGPLRPGCAALHSPRRAQPHRAPPRQLSQTAPSSAWSRQTRCVSGTRTRRRSPWQGPSPAAVSPRVP